MSSGTQKRLLELDDLDEQLTRGGFNQVSGGVLPDGLMWSVYQHNFRQSDIPRCIWVVTNLAPPVCHLAGNWTDDPDRAFDQVMTYVQTWLRSPDSFESLRERNRMRFTTPETADATTSEVGSEPSTVIKDTAQLAGSEIAKKVVNYGLDHLLPLGNP